MENVDFALYGFTTDKPPALKTAWNEQRRIVDLNKLCYVFETTRLKRNWRLIHRFPNADRSTLRYYWCKYADRRIKQSLNWQLEDVGLFKVNGATRSKIFGEN